MSSSRSQAYTDAGVNINAGNELVSRIKSLVASTRIPGVVSDIGGFGGLFRPELEGMKSPVLVSSTDGVGTKLKLASLFDKHDTVGIDLVAMSVNDILVQGAKPLFFLDYFATGELNVEQAESIIGGVAEGCRRGECALLVPGIASAAEESKTPPQDSDIVMGTSSSGIYQYYDTERNEWVSGVTTPPDESQSSSTMPGNVPLIVAPEIKLPYSGNYPVPLSLQNGSNQ